MTMSLARSRGYGADFSIRHGVLAQVDVSRQYGIVAYKVLMHYNDGPGQKSTTHAMMEFGHGLATSITEREELTASPVTVLLDWSAQEGFWKGNPQATLLKSYLMGLVTGHLTGVGITMLPYSPGDLRQWLGLRRNVSKEAVHDRFLAQNVHPKLQTTLAAMAKRKGVPEDTLDAIILGYVGAYLFPQRV